MHVRMKYIALKIKNSDERIWHQQNDYIARKRIDLINIPLPWRREWAIISHCDGDLADKLTTSDGWIELNGEDSGAAKNKHANRAYWMLFELIWLFTGTHAHLSWHGLCFAHSQSYLNKNKIRTFTIQWAYLSSGWLVGCSPVLCALNRKCNFIKEFIAAKQF